MDGLEVSYPRLVEKKALRNPNKKDYCRKWLLSSQVTTSLLHSPFRKVNRDKGSVKPWMDTLDAVETAGREGIGGFFPFRVVGDYARSL